LHACLGVATLFTDLLRGSLAVENVLEQVLTAGVFEGDFHTLKEFAQELGGVALFASFDGVWTTI